MKLNTSAIDNNDYVNDSLCFTYQNNSITMFSSVSPTTPIAVKFERLGNTWIESSTTSNETPAGNMKCYTLEEVQDFQSPYDFMEPVFQTMAIFSALFIFYIAYSLILKSFVRRV